MLVKQTVDFDVCDMVAFYGVGTPCPFCDHPYISMSSIEDKTEYVCSHCGNTWEVLSDKG